MCGCQKLSGMARRRSSKSVNITMEDVGYAMLGAVGSLALNGVVGKAVASQPANVQDTVGKALPVVKVVGGGYVAMNKKMPRPARFVGMGVAGTGSIELGVKFAPQYFSIGNTGGGDVFAFIGSPNTVQIPIEPAGGNDQLFEEEAVMGSEVLAADYVL